MMACLYPLVTSYTSDKPVGYHKCSLKVVRILKATSIQTYKRFCIGHTIRGNDKCMSRPTRFVVASRRCKSTPCEYFVKLLIPVAMASRITVHLSPFLAHWKRLSIHPVRPDGNTGLSHLRSPGTFEVIDNDNPIYQARILRVS